MFNWIQWLNPTNRWIKRCQEIENEKGIIDDSFDARTTIPDEQMPQVPDYDWDS